MIPQSLHIPKVTFGCWSRVFPLSPLFPDLFEVSLSYNVATIDNGFSSSKQIYVTRLIEFKFKA
ncbi:hypothetical protein I3760_10G156500 [Carya illinoinensis]|nr:hypothetical protein I3760_10G156500 [Carya illinoinensis]